jgi:hypothetical protein
VGGKAKAKATVAKVTVGKRKKEGEASGGGKLLG